MRQLLVRGFRLHRNEAARLNLTDSVTLQPGEDFATILGVIHNLHCLVGYLSLAIGMSLIKGEEDNSSIHARGLLLPQRYARTS